ncbi:hypothetical protein PGT21_035762 [Puccinia graminis f. sp. tritici]|uniref:Uncharacterized protein n=1 Tax=Puccinia graminis f. sp. tritici TaxID=56615 RepID=A0A5B0MAU7_PUCGR|nr:hypothetical protein PGTUg99_028088 [Puccinia graminis f. sp. tritici]KAA1084820.1 hypothetical protein PGT21_035762 [Puccinia graminis f. sp. tritici]
MFSQQPSHLFLYYLLALASDIAPLSASSSTPRTCTNVYQPISTSGDQTANQMTCRGTGNPQRSFICEQKSCEGSTTCQTCVAQLTNVSVNSIECAKYYVDDNRTNCWTSADEQFTCYGKCTGAAVCSDCNLDEQTPSISNCSGDSPSKHGTKASHASATSASNAGVTTWLAWD